MKRIRINKILKEVEHIGNYKKVKPTFEEFGLTSELYEKFKTEKNRIENRNEKVSNYLSGILASLFIGASGFYVGKNFFSDGIFNFLSFIVFGLITVLGAISIGLTIMMFLGAPIIVIVNEILKIKLKTKRFKSVKDYDNSFIDYNFFLRKKKEDFWRNLSGYDFEYELARLYDRMGHKCNLTKKSGDEGIDILIIEKDSSIQIAVQCKNHKNVCGPAVVRELYGVMVSKNITKGIVASRSGFSKGAVNFAIGKNIELISLNEILKMHDEY